MKGKKTQWYIGTPNGVVLCIDDRKEEKIRARCYHAYQEDPVEVETFEEMIFAMEHFFDSLNFPHPTTNERSFRPKDPVYHQTLERKKIMADETLLSRHGDLGSFIIRVQHRQNSSWQGRITWMEEDKTVHFRSIFEMVKLIESALDSVQPEHMSEEEITW